MAVKRYDGSAWQTVAGLGAQGPAATSSSIATWVKTASGGETSLSGNDDNSQSLSYTVGQELVFINGTLLKRGSDYTATNGTSITGLTALAANDVATVWTVNAFSVTNAISNTLVDAKGDLIVATAADTPARLAVGSANQVLTVDSSTATGLKWATPVTGSMTLLHTLTLNATSTTQSSISQAYKNLYIVGKNIGLTSGGDALRVRFAGRTGNYQGTRIEQGNITALSASGVDSVANDLSTTNGSAFHFTCFDYAETSSEKLITGQSVGNNTGSTCFYNISPFNLQTNIASVTITTVAGTATMSGTVEIYGVN